MEVYYGNFWADKPQEKAGRKIPIERRFAWYGWEWYIPAAYQCTEGIVLDVGRRIPMQQVCELMDKWGSRSDALSEEEQEELRTVNPFALDIKIEITSDIEYNKNSDANYNKNTDSSLERYSDRKDAGPLRMDGWSSIIWHTYGAEQPDRESLALMEEYGCDKADAWQFYRVCARWKESGQQPSFGLGLSLTAEPVKLAGETFTVNNGECGKTVEVCIPAEWEGDSCGRHILRVLSAKADILDSSAFEKEEMEYPTHMQLLEYRLDPPVPDGITVQVKDRSRGDSPRRKDGKSGNMACSVGVIYSSRGEDRDVRAQASSMHYIEVPQTEWEVSLLAEPVSPILLAELASVEGGRQASG